MFDITQYVWILWSLLLLGVWMILYMYIQNTSNKRKMITVSLGTALLGLTEPIFVPEYWNPPSLFNLAANTGFDIESIVFAFAIGGIAVVIYDRLFKVRMTRMSATERNHKRHRIHYLALASTPIIFFVLYATTTLNPIYSVIIAFTLGGLFTWYCRPDLKKKMFFSALLFTILYYIYFLPIVLLFPGYVEDVWNSNALTGILITGIPIEELLFAASFGFIWSSLYEHITWKKLPM